ncbi:MAG: hypothetical protein WCD79_17240 [Chthoniobacteraceae bacterium]
MSRKAIPRALPLLEEIFPDFAGFPESASKREALTGELRVIAKGLRAARPQPFYSMRDIAKYFTLPLSMVGLAYKALENEGILTRIRGSRTLVASKAVSPRKHVRAVIGFPTWMHSLVVSPYSKALHIELEDRLQENGFVADFIFFYNNQDKHLDFAERLLRRNLNIIIWHTPAPAMSQVMHVIADHGIQQIVMQITECTAVFEHPIYRLDWQCAYHAAGEEWRRCGIRHVILPYPARMHSKRVLGMFTEVMKEKGMSVEVIESSAQALHSKAKLLSDSAPVMVAFLDQVGAELLFNERPVVMEEMLRFSRIAFCRGPIRVPYFECRGLSADLVGLNAGAIAGKLATDLRMLPDIPRKILDTFHAAYTPDVAFSNCRQIL